MLDGMSDYQLSRIENLHSREVDRQSPTGLIFYFWNRCNIYNCPRLPRLWLQTHVVPAQSYVGYQWATAEITALLQKIERWQFALVLIRLPFVEPSW